MSDKAQMNRAPAQMVGGMRVGEPRRGSLTHDSQQQSIENNSHGELLDLEEEKRQQQMEEMDKRKQEQTRQENAMRTQHASRDINISNNAGSNVHNRTNPGAYQPRDLNH
ncbi:hypothetical protein [Absidia glauca]|uniref:Uncharacterized protein n=1 Tax=Absidia glauca TaxID=4829 RepID=A0A163LYG8_ABSGL|nr:hypothetical protein [Absidia glauca]